MLPLRAKRRLARIQTEDGDDLFTAHASELACSQRCLDGTPTTRCFSALHDGEA